MYQDKTYFIGFTSKIIREELVDIPPVPINFKDPIKIQERVDANTAKVRPLAEVCPGIATVEEIQVYNYYGEPVFIAARNVDSHFNSPAVKFWSWIDGFLGCYRTGHTIALMHEKFVDPESFIAGPLFFGFRIKAFMAMTALEAIHYNRVIGTNHPKIRVPIQIWRDHVGVGDPYKILFTDEQRKILTLDKAIQLLFDVALDVESLYQNPRRQAILAHKMTLRGQLLGTNAMVNIGCADDNEHCKEDSAARSS